MELVKFLDNQYLFEDRIIVYDSKYSVGRRLELIKVCWGILSRLSGYNRKEMRLLEVIF